MAEAKTRRKKVEVQPAALWVATSELVPWPDNPRKNDGPPVEKVAGSIKRFGFAAPIIARTADRMVIAGHTRLKAAKMLGLDKVPVRYLDLDPADARLLALADNKLGELADWDEGSLSRVLSELEAGGMDLSFGGFSEDELGAILGRESFDELPPSDFSELDVVETEHTCPKCGYEWR